MELCAFLDAAHNFAAVIDGQPRRSVVHGDLKPQNVRSSRAAPSKCSTRIAKALSLSRKVTRNDFGTRPYPLAERLDDDGEVNEFADLWAVGVMLYEMIRGARPFEAPDTQRLERIIRSRQPAPALTGDCPDGLAAIVARLLGPTPDVRYESCARHSRGPRALHGRTTNDGRGARVAGTCDVEERPTHDTTRRITD
jgi:serine/threonine protein kinase